MNIAITDLICGPIIRMDHSNTSIHNKKNNIIFGALKTHGFQKVCIMTFRVTEYSLTF